MSSDPAPARRRFAEKMARADAALRTDLTAQWILAEFDAYYTDYRNIAFHAEKAFETRNFSASLALSKKRLSVYRESIVASEPGLVTAWPELAADEALWRPVEERYQQLIRGRYEADLAYAYINSMKRAICFIEWRPVDYSFGGLDRLRGLNKPSVVHWTYPVSGRVDAATVAAILDIPGFERRYRDADGDAAQVAERLNRDGAEIEKIEMIAAGFYRNRGAYLVGRLVGGGVYRPLILALLNDDGGIYVDALITDAAAAHNLFSSTLANFHVTHMCYHELVSFLHSIMPERPPGLHYTTIGYNHFGKVAVISELKQELEIGARFAHAVGSRGTVAIGFAEPNSAYNLKVIRDRPTDGYKWDVFDGVAGVLQKYRRVHEINRTGSMLDNIIYVNIRLARASFANDLLDELLTEAAESVSLRGDDVIFRHLVVQRKMTPLPVFLQTASDADADTAIVNLGDCIKNNAAGNIFNKDLDARNYGVSRLRKVYLFDYDAVEPFTEVKIRSNLDQIDGEEDVPDWFFEDGVVFLPEEIEAGLMLEDRALRRRFRERHGDLLSVDYWQRVQDDLLAGRVPGIRTYPLENELDGAAAARRRGRRAVDGDDAGGLG